MDQPSHTGDAIVAIGALAEPTRRALYDHVSRSAGPVGRDEAAQAVGIGRPLAAFHLDRLAEVGLLVVEYRRLSGRSGPGAGRPAKLYARAPGTIGASLPGRRYDAAAAMLASAVAAARDGDTTGSIVAAVDASGRAAGRALVAAARAKAATADADATSLTTIAETGEIATAADTDAGDAMAAGTEGGARVPTAGAGAGARVGRVHGGGPSDVGHTGGPSDVGHTGVAAGPDSAAAGVMAALDAGGFEPELITPDRIRLRNCPFEAIARDHPDVVCAMSLALVGGIVDALPDARLAAVPAGVVGPCCVEVVRRA